MMRALALAFCLLVSACATVRPISPPGMKAFELSLATSGTDMMVAWHGGATGRDSIYIQSLDNAGRPRGSPHQITNGARYAYEPDLQLIDGDALVAWYEKDAATGKLTAPPFKCGPPENARAWKALVTEFFAGIDRTPAC